MTHNQGRFGGVYALADARAKWRVGGGDVGGVCLVPSCVAPRSVAQNADLSPTVQAYVSVKAGKVVLTHVRVIDGTGGPAVIRLQSP
jgi:hypothetical protein